MARRAELQNKPSWADAPEWANWLCQRDDGMWFWCVEEPRVSENGWETRHEARAAYPSGDQIPEYVLGDWRDTLERRPVDLSEPAVTALLTKDAENMLAAVPELMDEKFSIDRNDWFERGELPPVGTECEFCGGTGDADDPWHPDLMDGDRVTVIAHFECGICTLAAFTFKSRNPNIATVLVEQANYGCFRPIRTERDKAIDEMKQHCPHHGSWDTVGRIYAEALYDAGYRKQNFPAK
ncbi:hypothetical protein [Aeromonas veronii]|uniref:hypothetical protein n=1 Tax=Aeromonas veronii TaxID=654 RepID=UPI0015DCAED9|nr:hypothetical protein [Aeromonas veronii]BBU05085.1 hypothetical protein WP9W18E04_24240 [Aeromonas veronii]